MPGPVPKPPGLRQRRNRVSTKATLPSEAEAAKQEVPSLPPLGGKGEWDARVLAWWEVVWQSPMATEFMRADRDSLFIIARLRQDFWRARSSKDRQRISSELRQQEVRFGLSPIDRRRLQWEVEKGEVAADRTETRRKRKRPDSKKDPREVLKLA